MDRWERRVWALDQWWACACSRRFHVRCAIQMRKTNPIRENHSQVLAASRVAERGRAGVGGDVPGCAMSGRARAKCAKRTQFARKPIQPDDASRVIAHAPRRHGFTSEESPGLRSRYAPGRSAVESRGSLRSPGAYAAATFSFTRSIWAPTALSFCSIFS